MTTSVYVATCIRCGKVHRTPETEFRCECGLVIELRWPADAPAGTRERTITERYEG